MRQPVDILRRSAALAALVLLGLACSRAEAPPPRGEAPSASPPGKPSAPFDVGAVIRQVRLSFRPLETGWRGGHSTYEVRAGPEGLTLTPVHFPRASRPVELESLTATRPLELVPPAKKRLEPARLGPRQPREQGVKGAPLRLEAARITRGGKRLGSAAPQGRVEPDGHLAFTRGDIVEHLRNREDGVEQSWTFASAPPGRGDVLVQLPVKGLAYRGRTAHGLHFAEARTGLGFRYGHATWVERSGRRTSLEAEYASGHIRLRVPAALLESSEYPAVLDPIISPEVGTDAPVHGPALYSEEVPALAFNGTDYLVVWQDTRGISTYDLYGARVSRTGQVLDPGGLLISAHMLGHEVSPAVASNGTDFLVVWQDGRGATAFDILGARVTGTGQVLDPEGIPISAHDTFYQAAPAVASNGTNYLVVWQDGRSGTTYDIHGARVSSAGTVLDPAGLALSTHETGDQEAPAVASNGTDYLVVWHDTRNSTYDIYGTRVTGAGQVLDPTGLALSTHANGYGAYPSVASNGTDYLVVWQDTRSGAEDIYGTRVTGAGAVQDPAGLPLSAHETIYQWTPTVASNGTEYLVVWMDGRGAISWDIYGTRVSGAGAVLDPTGLVLSNQAWGNEAYPVVVSNGTDFFAVWQDGRSAISWDIHGTRITGAGEVLDPDSLLLSTTANHQYAPAVASNGTNHLVVWQDARNVFHWDVHATRVSSTGEVLDPSGLVLSALAGYQYSVAVASNGADYLVVWRDGRNGNDDIYGTRVSGSGAVLEPEGLALGVGPGTQSAPAVASNGRDYLVIWQDDRDSFRSLYGARVAGDGKVLDATPRVLTTGTGAQSAPTVASNGTDYFVAWEDSRNGSTDIYGARVSSTGQTLEPNGLALSTASNSQQAPAVASNGADYLVVWQDGRNSVMDLYGTRVSGAGTVLDPGGLVVSAGVDSYELAPAVASNGADYLVVWQDGRNLLHWDIFGARVTDSGVVREPQGLGISMLASHETAPRVTSAGASTFFVVYQRLDSDPRHGSERVHGRFVSFEDAPLATPLSLTTAEDQPVALTLSGSSPRNPSLTYALRTPPSRGVLSGTPPALTYTPAADFHGMDRFTYVVNDGTETSGLAIVHITVTPVNDAPVALEQAVATRENRGVPITLTGSDVDGDTLGFTVDAEPSHGTLLGTPPELIYRPAPDFHGTDRFTFTVTDGALTSAPATVSLTVKLADRPPMAHGQAAHTREDTAVSLVLVGSDPNEEPLTFAIASAPAYGTLSGRPPAVTYIPAPDFHGSDSFSFTVSDGRNTSPPAEVLLTVDPLPDAPRAHAQTVTLDQGQTVALTLSGRDPDGDPVSSLQLASEPEGGTLTGTPPELLFTPRTGFRGETSFTFTVAAGGATSEPARFTLVVRNLPPLASASADRLHPLEGEPVRFTASVSDPGGDALGLHWDFGDGHTSTEDTPSHVFADEGPHTVTLSVSDGLAVSTTPVELEVLNAAPILLSEVVPAQGDEGATLAFQAEASDPGTQDALHYTWDFGDGSAPASGPRATHAFPEDGRYRVTLTLDDGDGATTTWSREVVVLNLPPVPTALDVQSARVGEPFTLTLQATDAAGARDPLTWSKEAGPGEVLADGTFRWTPDLPREVHTLHARVTDDEGGTADVFVSLRSEAALPPEDSGCGCRGGAGGGASALLGLLVLRALGRRSRPPPHRPGHQGAMA
jgi:PKD repeat protein